MPAKNVIKDFVADSYYHIYARGNNKQIIFMDNNDKSYFMNLFDRYLSNNEAINTMNRLYPNYGSNIKIIAYCLMRNHFHAILYQKEVPFMEKFMRSVMTSYSKYFNLKYKRTGPVYESRYKAVRIIDGTQLQHLSRYIHLNPSNWKSHRYSSIGYYEKGNEPSWLDSGIVLDQFSSTEEYMEFVESYETEHNELEELKHQLIDD